MRGAASRIARRLLVAPIRAYRVVLSPLKPPTCRFQPSCSEYAILAVERHGCLRGAWLTTRRICRCHPFGGYGEDPVPPRLPASPPPSLPPSLPPSQGVSR